MFSTMCLMTMAIAGPAWAQTANTPAAPADPKPSPKIDRRHREWAQDARWYHVVVPNFHNSAAANDPAASPNKAPARSADGRGDLKGLQQQLPYIKNMGFNALLLAGVFEESGDLPRRKVDLRHVDDRIGVKQAPAARGPEAFDAKSWKFTESDNLFLGMVQAAHRAGFKVVLDVPMNDVLLPEDDQQTPAFITAACERWIRPDPKNEALHGVDGLLIRNPQRLPRPAWKAWKDRMIRANPAALLLCDVGPNPSAWVAPDLFDAAVNREASAAIRHFFAGDPSKSDPKALLSALAPADRQPPDTLLLAPLPMSDQNTGRFPAKLLEKHGQFTSNQRPQPPPVSVETVAARRQLATIVQYFAPGTPVTLAGNEKGLIESPKRDRSSPASKVGEKGETNAALGQSHFTSLLQWLNTRRELHRPLRHGRFRAVLHDAERRVFAFARSLPGDEIILVVNCGSGPQTAVVPVGQAGQLIGVLTPRLNDPVKARASQRGNRIDPRSTGIAALKMSGSRQFVRPDGTVRLRLAPVSVALVIVSEQFSK